MDRAKMHDAACEIANAETADLLDAKDDAFIRYSNAAAAFDEAHRATYDKAYDDLLEKQHER